MFTFTGAMVTGEASRVGCGYIFGLRMLNAKLNNRSSQWSMGLIMAVRIMYYLGLYFSFSTSNTPSCAHTALTGKRKRLPTREAPTHPFFNSVRNIVTFPVQLFCIIKFGLQL